MLTAQYNDVLRPSPIPVDVLVVGAGITGIYQLHRAREAGFSVGLLEAGDGVGGTWFWNRYPGARFDSESYTYGYLFSKELFDEWEWQEHFAGQPEIERYLNHVIDRFDLRRHMRFGARVDGGGVRRAVRHLGRDDRRRRPRPGPASSSRPPACCRCPTSPTSPGATTSVACSTTPAAGRPSRSTSPASGWRSIGTSSSGVQVVPADRRRGRVAHRVPAQRQLVHAAQQPTDHRRRAGRAAGRLRAAARGAEHLDPRLPPPDERARRLRRLTRGAAGVLRGDVGQPRVHEVHEQLRRHPHQPGRQRRVVRVHRREDPRHRARTPTPRSG